MQRLDRSASDPIEIGAVWTTIALSILILLWSRLVGLDLSLWHDEVVTILRFVDGGPEDILFGNYSTNNHLLFNFLTWASVTLSGTTEAIFRYWAVVPALVIAGAGSNWLFRRFGRSTAAVFLVLLAANPLLTVLARQARGYGLAMACVGFLVMAAWKALEPGAPHSALIPVGVAATLGIFTLPTVVLPFVVLIPLLFLAHRRWAIWMLLGVGIASLGWYSGALIRLVSSVDQEFGGPLAWHAAFTGPVQYLAFPIFNLFREGELNAFRMPESGITLGTLPIYLIVMFLGVLGVSRLARVGSALQAAVFWVPIIGSFVLLTLSRVWILDRFVSFLGVPMMILLASGIVETFSRIRLDRRLLALVGAATATYVLSLSVPTYQRLTTVPIEAFEEVGQLVDSASGPVFTNSLRPPGLNFYIDRPIVIMSNENLIARVCGLEGERYVVIDHTVVQEQGFDATCLERSAATLTTFEQLIRGHINVWLVGQ